MSNSYRFFLVLLSIIYRERMREVDAVAITIS